MWWQIFVCDVGGAPSLGRAGNGCRAFTRGLEGRPQGSPLRRLLFAERRGGVLFESSPRRLGSCAGESWLVRHSIFPAPPTSPDRRPSVRQIKVLPPVIARLFLELAL